MDKKNWIACGCEKCRVPCEHRPCWGTPEEAQAIIDADIGDRLMLDHWMRLNDKGGNINILSPAIIEYEGKGAPLAPFGQCTFYNKDNGCELHDLGLKPIEGRLGLPCQEEFPKGLHEYVAMLWDNPEAQKLANSFEIKPNAAIELLSLLDAMVGSAQEGKTTEETT